MSVTDRGPVPARDSSSAATHVVERMRSSTRATPTFLGLLFVLLLIAQLVLYRQSFSVKPSNDDFIALHQIERGEEEGVWSFFMASDAGDYRPLQNVTFWLFGRISRQHILLSLRILHFLSFIFYALVAFLWIRVASVNRVGAVAAACVVFLHPTLAGALGGLDNYSRFVVSAWVWLGTWIAYVHGKRPWLAVPLVSLCFVIGLGYMEYAIALIPLALLATAWEGGRRSWQGALVMFASLLTIFGAYFLMRVSGRVATTAGTGFLSLDPGDWLKNIALMLGAGLFFGNTVPILQDVSLAGLVWLASNVTLVVLALAYGFWAGRHEVVPSAGADPRSTSVAMAIPTRRFGFLCAACVVSFFPMVLMRHTSEIYLSAVTLGLALLIGVSAQCWTTLSRPLRCLGLCLAGSQLLLAADAIQCKVAGINETGERADAMMHRLLEHLPVDGGAKRVAMVFLKQEGTGSKGYSVFAMPDDQLVLRGYGTFALHWFRPDQDIRLDDLVVPDPSVVDFKSYDVVLLWDGSSRQFSPIGVSPGQRLPSHPALPGPTRSSGLSARRFLDCAPGHSLDFPGYSLDSVVFRDRRTPAKDMLA